MYKKVYDKNKGIFIYVDALSGTEIGQGSGIFDTLTKLFSSGVSSAGKKALETVGKTALESGTKKIGTEVGNLASAKLTKTIKSFNKPAPPVKPSASSAAVGNLIAKELKKVNNNSDDNDINLRINRLLSGDTLNARSGRRNRINRLIKKIKNIYNIHVQNKTVL